MAPTTSIGPLAGLKVVELSHIMAGPTCGLMLADMGADVIKVERFPGGDDTRRTVPPEIEGESAEPYDVVAFAAGLAKINDPWGDLVTWYRDFRVVNERYRLVSGALQTAPIPGNDASNVSELPRKWAKAGHS